MGFFGHSFHFVCLFVRSFRLGKVSFRQVLNLLEYLKNEMEAAPLTEALTQLGSIYRLLEKRSDLNLVSRMKVCFFFFFSLDISQSGFVFTEKCFEKAKQNRQLGPSGDENKFFFFFFFLEVHF